MACTSLTRATYHDPWTHRATRLSVRENEVLQLLSEGHTDPEIAQRLVVSPRTVQGHVASALRKTGSRSRTQLAVRYVTEVLDERHA